MDIWKILTHVIHLNTKRISNFNEDLHQFAWNEEDGSLLPEKLSCAMGKYFMVHCGCIVKCSKQCRYIKNVNIFALNSAHVLGIVAIYENQSLLENIRICELHFDYFVYFAPKF